MMIGGVLLYYSYANETNGAGTNAWPGEAAPYNEMDRWAKVDSEQAQPDRWNERLLGSPTHCHKSSQAALQPVSRNLIRKNDIIQITMYSGGENCLDWGWVTLVVVPGRKRILITSYCKLTVKTVQMKPDSEREQLERNKENPGRNERIGRIKAELAGEHTNPVISGLC